MKVFKGWIIFIFVVFSGLSQSLPSFAEYMSMFHKNYTTHSRSIRQQIYETNIQQIQAHNSNPTHTWRMGVNAFTDLTWEEFWNGRQSIQTTTRDTLFEHTLLEPVRNIPLTVNWSRYLNPVQDQAKCGSCWAFAAVTAIESSYAIQTRLLYNLSEQQVLDCTPNAFGCNGGWMHYAYQYAKTSHLCATASYPYQAQKGRCRQRTCKGYVRIRQTIPFYGENNLRNAVAQQPIAIALGISPLFQHYKSGLFMGPCSTSPNHAVLVVGYTPTEWLIQNSWGETWGEKGWIRIGRDKQLCGIGRYRSDLLYF